MRTTKLAFEPWCTVLGMADDQRRFIRVPVETVQSCVDKLNVQTSDEVCIGLAEDVSFRVRQIAENACQFMQHSKRRQLTADDMEKAMKYAGLEPLYGHHSALPHQYSDLELEQVASTHVAADHLPSSHTPSVTAAWQVVEGEQLEDREVLQGNIQLDQNPSESQQTFLSLILEATTGDDEDKRRVALATVQSKPAIASILPSLIQYLQQTLANWDQFVPSQLKRVLRLTFSLFANTGLYLGSYLSSIYPPLRGILFSPDYLACDGEIHHWHVRHIAAAAMAQLLKRCDSTLNVYSRELSSDFQQVFSEPREGSSIPVLYGSIMVLCNLGYASVAEVLFPRLETLVGFFAAKMESTAKDDLSKLQEALLVAAKVLLVSDDRKTLLLPTRNSSRTDKPSLHHNDTTAHPSHLSGGDATHVTATSGGDVSASRVATGGGGGAGGGGGDDGSASRAETGGGSETSLFSGSALGLSAVDVGGNSHAGIDTDRKSPSHTESPSHLTLYDYLAEVIGEGLTLSLTPNARLVEAEKVKPNATIPKTLPELSKTATSKHTASSLERFLGREGFRPIRVQLPLRVPPPPSVPRGYYKGRDPWTFHVPQTLLPVSGNVLEKKQRSRSHRKLHPAAGKQGVMKGPHAGHHKHYRHQGYVNIATSWI